MFVHKRIVDDLEVIQFLSENSTCFFNRKEWFSVLKEGFNVPVVCYCVEENGKILLALPGMVFNFGIIKMFYSNIPYGGFVGSFELIPKSLNLIEESLKKDGISVIRIGRNFNNDYPNLNGYKQQIAFTHLLNVENMTEEELWNFYKKRVRRDIRKAEKSGIYLEEITHPIEIEELFNLYIQTMQRNMAYTIWTKKSLYSIYNHLVKSNKAKIIMAKKDREIIAGIILLLSEDTLYYFFSASSKEYLKYCPNDLLVHHSICLAIREGKKYFDLMTSKKDDIALMNFKEKWGAKRYPFYFFEKKLSLLRPLIWDQIWKLANSKIGVHIIRTLKKG